MAPAGQRLESGNIQRFTRELRLQAASSSSSRFRGRGAGRSRSGDVLRTTPSWRDRNDARYRDPPVSPGPTRCSAWRNSVVTTYLAVARMERDAHAGAQSKLLAAHGYRAGEAARGILARERHDRRLVVGIVDRNSTEIRRRRGGPRRRDRSVRSRSRRATISVSASSPPSCPNVSLMSRKPSRSNRITAPRIAEPWLSVLAIRFLECGRCRVPAVGQAGQRVVMRQEVDPRLGQRGALGDVRCRQSATVPSGRRRGRWRVITDDRAVGPRRLGIASARGIGHYGNATHRQLFAATTLPPAFSDPNAAIDAVARIAARASDDILARRRRVMPEVQAATKIRQNSRWPGEKGGVYDQGAATRSPSPRRWRRSRSWRPSMSTGRPSRWW